MRIERTTSPLPRECSTTELQEPAVSFLREIAAFRVSSCTNSYTSKPLTLHFPHQNAPELTRRFFNRHTALQLQNSGAGERDRTVVCSLEGCRSTIELLPPLAHHVRHGTNDYTTTNQRLLPPTTKNWWRELDSNQRTRKRADLQSAAINHSAISPREPGIIKTFAENVNLHSSLESHPAKIPAEHQLDD